MLKSGQIVDGWYGEILLYLGCGHKAIAILVDLYINNVPLTLLHAALLLAEWAEDIFHQTPVEECTELVNPSHLEANKLANLGIWQRRQ